jgi:hypothetical protein
MAWKGIKHKTVGEQIDDEAEWTAEDLHEIANGTELPSTGNDGDFYFKTDEHRLYIWKEE